MLAQFEQALLVMENARQTPTTSTRVPRRAHDQGHVPGCSASTRWWRSRTRSRRCWKALRAGQLPSTSRRRRLLQAATRSRPCSTRCAPAAPIRRGGAQPRAGAGSCAGCWRRLGGRRSVPEAVTVRWHRRNSRHGGVWHLSLRFGADALRNGLDPLAFMRYLRQVGQVEQLPHAGRRMPALELLDAEDCRLGFEIRLRVRGPRSDRAMSSSSPSTTAASRILAPDAPANGDALLSERCADDAGRDRTDCAVWRSMGVRRLWRARPCAGRRADATLDPAARRRRAGATPPQRARAPNRARDRRPATRPASSRCAPTSSTT
jgi:two-component system chemotaxis sensor kinase CheA